MTEHGTSPTSHGTSGETQSRTEAAVRKARGYLRRAADLVEPSAEYTEWLTEGPQIVASLLWQFDHPEATPQETPQQDRAAPAAATTYFEVRWTPESYYPGVRVPTRETANAVVAEIKRLLPRVGDIDVHEITVHDGTAEDLAVIAFSEWSDWFENDGALDDLDDDEREAFFAYRRLPR